jgi:membrane protein DedA with SNARE-associated domain
MNPLIELLIRYGYGLIFVGVFAEQLGLPLPSGLLMITAGALSGIGHLNVHSSFLWAILGCLLGDQFWYHMGRRKGSAVLPLLCRLSFNPDACVRQTRNFFSRYGEKSLLVVKFFPGVNAIAAPLSGVMQMNFLRFVVFDGLGAFLWIGTFIGTGYWLGNRIDFVSGYFSQMGSLLSVTLLGGLILFTVWKLAQRQLFLRQLRMARITPQELKEKLDSAGDPLIFDIRSPLEVEAAPHMIPGALHLPLEKMLREPPQISNNQEVILYCD